MDSNNHILIDRYLNGELGPEELLLFEKQLAADEQLRAETELHKQVLEGIDSYGANLLRAEIAAIGVQVKTGDLLDKYQPAKGGGSWFWSVLKWLGLAGIIGAGVYVYQTPELKERIVPDKAEIESVIERIENPTEQTIPVTTRGDTMIRIETVYHTIKVKNVKPGDTVIVTSKEQLDELMKQQGQ